MATNTYRSSYVRGNTVRRQRPLEDNYRTPQRVEYRGRKKKHPAMNIGFVAFLSLALLVTGVTCIQYIKLQSTVTEYVGQISSLEIKLEELRASNDDMEGRIKGTVCLEDIKKRAMEDLGMTYAREDQIVVYQSDGTDYVRQFVSIEE